MLSTSSSLTSSRSGGSELSDGVEHPGNLLCAFWSVVPDPSDARFEPRPRDIRLRCWRRHGLEIEPEHLANLHDVVADRFEFAVADPSHLARVNLR